MQKYPAISEKLHSPSGIQDWPHALHFWMDFDL